MILLSIQIATLIVTLAINFGLAFFLGKIHERTEWNTLIEKGIITTPKGK